ncbi:MAG: hypothetical protein HOC71_10480 [Candidatus Latescibacteria bacterium]|jgi:hypothetical protein|nr:hypothetical protein [Candidatus Latescibacterota bacterium]
MIRLFSDLVESAATGEKAAIRALQAWQFLIGKANDRQTLRYGDLANLMGYTDNRPLSSILGHIMYFCNQKGLPPLTIIVVNKDGTPGEGFSDAAPDEFHKKREEVFLFDWFGVMPPTIQEFRKAWVAAE